MELPLFESAEGDVSVICYISNAAIWLYLILLSQSVTYPT